MKPDEVDGLSACNCQAAGAVVVSVVIPFFNEEHAARDLLNETLAVLSSLGECYECLCVDDGSRDRTDAIINRIASRPDSHVRLISFKRNRGQGAALFRGLQEAKGQIVITLDGDGQNDPRDIPLLIETLAGCDLVCGVRLDRKDSYLRRGMSQFANGVRSRLLGDGMRDSGCAIKAMRREVIHALMPIRTLYSFIPAMAAAAGFRIMQIPVRHRARQGGRSNYGAIAFAWWPLIDMMGLVWYRQRCCLRTSDFPSHWPRNTLP